MRKEQTVLQADSAAGLRVLETYHCLPVHPSFQLHLGNWIIILRLQDQTEGMRVADSSELNLDDPSISASLMVFCPFLSIHELSETLWFPALNKEDVKSTEFDELPGI